MVTRKEKQNEEILLFRFGIGNDFPKGGQVDYVLGKFTSEEESTIAPRLDIAKEIITSFCLAGAARTMTQYNNK